jgi:hypothetical protein
MSIWFFALGTAFFALSTGLLVYFVMQSRHEVQLAEQRESLTEARATLEAQKQSLAGMLTTVEETTRRTAFDQFLSEIRIEERHYLREHKLLFVTRKSVVVRERIFFRNLPLSSWVEHEIPYEEGADVEKLAKTSAIFTPEFFLDSGSNSAPKKLTSVIFD